MIGVLEWICYLRPIPPPSEDPEDTCCTNIVRSQFVSVAPASFKSSGLFFSEERTDLTMGTAATELGKQNAMEIIRSWAGRGHIVAFSGQRQGGFAQKGERSNQHSLIYTEAIVSFWDILKEQW